MKPSFTPSYADAARAVLIAYDAACVIASVTHLARTPDLVGGLRAILARAAETRAAEWFRAEGTPEGGAVADAVDDVLHVLDGARRHLDDLAVAGERLRAAVRAWTATQPTPSAPGGDA